MHTYERAKTYMYRHARPLDLARFQYHFENGSKENVLRALAYYQNEDGGFGHALEADGWNPHSAPGQTCTAAGILLEIGMEDKCHPMIQGMLRYLASGHGFTGTHWESTIESNNDYPCAPWWKAGSVSTSHHVYNITTALAGFIIRFADPGTELYQLGCRIAGEACEYLLSPDAKCDMHVLCCFQQMIRWCEEAGATTLFDLPRLKEKLLAMMQQAIHPDKEKWSVLYTATPSVFLRDRKHPLYAKIAQLAEYEVQSIIAAQEQDGSWPITWCWDAYPEEWAISKVWWKGTQIVEKLLFLHGMGALKVQSRCGIVCSDCRFTECKGCASIADPFWGHCDVKACCEEKRHTHCGQCAQFPCDVLHSYAYEENEGDDGQRIEQCKVWLNSI